MKITQNLELNDEQIQSPQNIDNGINPLSKIEQSIYRFQGLNRGLMPTIINCHPETWWDICKQQPLNHINESYKPTKPIYKGIKIVRSFDIKQDEFICSAETWN